MLYVNLFIKFFRVFSLAMHQLLFGILRWRSCFRSFTAVSAPFVDFLKPPLRVLSSSLTFGSRMITDFMINSYRPLNPNLILPVNMLSLSFRSLSDLDCAFDFWDLFTFISFGTLKWCISYCTCSNGNLLFCIVESIILQASLSSRQRVFAFISPWSK